MRLFIVGIKAPPETFLARKIAGLLRAGVDVTVYSNTSGKVQEEVSNARWIRLPKLRGKRAILTHLRLLAKRIRSHPQEVMRTWRISKKYKSRHIVSPVFLQLLTFIGESPDIIHFEWNIAAIDYLPLFDFFDCPIVISCRGRQVQVTPHNPQRESMVGGLKETFARATAIHCVSEAIRDEGAPYGLEPSKAHIIRPAVDPGFFDSMSSNHNSGKPVHIVTTASLIWRKGHEYTLMALHLLKQRGYDFCFEIIGTGVDFQRILYTAADLGIEQQVRLAGQRTPQQVKETLQNADIFVLSSLSEGIANAVLEAMACGLPVVTTDCGGMREVITDGLDGFVVPLRDAEAMADKLEKLVVDKNLRVRMGEAARERIVEEFTLAKQNQQFLALYQSLLAQPQEAVRIAAL